MTGRVSTIAATLILARLLSPVDFGIANIGTLVLMVLLPLTDIGITRAVVRSTPATLAARAGTAFWFVLGLGAFFYSILYICSDAIAAFYHRPEAAGALRVIGISIVLYSASRVPAAVLERDLRYGRKAIPEVAASFIYAVAAVGLALLHFGFWSIVLATVVRSTAVSGGLFLAVWSRPPLRIFRWAALDLFRAAGVLSAASAVRLIYTNADNAIVGRVNGVTPLGYYAMAYNLGNMVAIQVAGALGGVLFPAYTRMLPDLGRVRSASLRLLRWVSLIVLPITAFGVIGAPELVPRVLGQRWTPLTAALQVLLVYGCFHSFGPIHWALLQAGDHNRTNLAINIVSLVLALAAALPVAAAFGFLGIAIEFTVLEALRFILLAWSVRRHFGVGIRRQMGAVSSGLVGTTVAVLALLALRAVWRPDHLAVLMAEFMVAAIIYTAYQVHRGVLSNPLGGR
ncbi:MAG: oligosaccharide flippase family protein [Candidatus Dormibacteraeota bacterium]|nr:oligosaccharide flippase family protein [Candidatus Dormibacteraeota bacterium]